MPSIEQNIIDWAKDRPTWQGNLLKRIARGETVNVAYIEAIVTEIVHGKVTLETPELAVADLPTGTAGGAKAQLLSVGELKNVNALLENQTLTFGATGVTVIYGDNGSGKSGYARLVKDVVGARHYEAILPDAFATSPGAPSATIAYDISGTERAGTWPSFEEPALGQIHFYDEACGDDYLQHETELAYRPSVLNLLDALIVHVDAIRAVVDEKIAVNHSTKLVPPAVPLATKAATFLSGISATTTQQEIDAFLTLPAGAEETHADFVKEEARLRATDPAEEKKRLARASKQVAALATHFDEIESALSSSAADALVKLKTDADTLRAASDQASRTSFADEPLSGVGSDTWRALWEAAERFSTAEAYPNEEFPANDNGQVCVLCQQPLASDAQARLRRFHQFVHNDVAKRASATEDAFKAAVGGLRDLEVTTAATESAIAFLALGHKDLADSLTGALEVAARAKAQLGKRLEGENSDPWIDLASVDTNDLCTRAAMLATTAESIDETAFKQNLAAATSQRDELGGLISLEGVKKAIEVEVKRLKRDATLRKTLRLLSTAPITTESTSLSRKYVTEAVKSHFIRESERLKLEHVVLGDKGGAKGKIRHRPALLGASGNTPSEVLSEGEQTAAGLAGFFTEIEFDATKSAVVLDDPMSSLDHERRERVARRVVEIAKDRQVIVFTHDLMFLGEIVKASDELDVPLTERAIERNGARKPGCVVDGHPWKARDAKARIGDLQAGLDRLTKAANGMEAEDYERAAAEWARKLSETWERIVRSEVAFKLVDRGTAEVRPKMFKIAARITEFDNTDFQAGYGATSKWARRHDKSEEVNYVAPDVAEMQAELDRIKSWRDQVSKYENK